MEQSDFPWPGKCIVFRKGKAKEDTGESGIINRKRDRKRVRMKYSALFMLSYFFFDFDEFLEASSLAASLALAKNPFFFFGASRGPLTPLTPVI